MLADRLISCPVHRYSGYIIQSRAFLASDALLLLVNKIYMA